MNRTKKTMKVVLVFALTLVLLVNAFMPIAVQGSRRDTSADYQFYAVKAGDTLTKIAKQNGITISDIMTANGLSNADRIYTGQVLKVPVSSASGAQNPLSSCNLTMHLHEADVRDVISAIALNAGYTVIMEKSASNNADKITVDLENMSALKALDAVTRLVGLTFLKDGSTIMVGTADGLNSTFVDKTVFSKIQLNYISAEALQAQMSALGLSNVQILSTNNKDEFFISGYPKELAKVEELRKMLDVQSNIMPGGGLIPSNFFSIQLTYIDASEFNGLLGDLGLSQGIVLGSRPNTLYLYVSGQNLADIRAIQKIVDQPVAGTVVPDGGQSQTPGEGTAPAPEATVLQQVTLEYITRKEAVSILQSFPYKLQVFGPEKYTKALWLSGTSSEVQTAVNMLKDKYDTAEYAKVALRGDTVVFPYDLQYCSAQEMLSRLETFPLDGVTLRPNGNPAVTKSLLIYCPENMEAELKSLLSDMDVAATNAEKTFYVLESTDNAGVANARIALLKDLYPSIADTAVYEFKVTNVPNQAGEVKCVTYVKTTSEGITYLKGVLNEMNSAG